MQDWYPIMSPEVLEAIHTAYVDYPSVEVDCLLYLAGLAEHKMSVLDLSDQANRKLFDMGKCSKCGENLSVHHYKEPHPELDGCPMEDMTELYCPNCDTGVNDY